MEKYKDLGARYFKVLHLMRNKEKNELVVVKYIPRGPQIDKFVPMGIINHRLLRHPNIIQFKEVVLTPTHLAIVMEHAAGGTLSDRIHGAGRLSEDEARNFFQQLICAISYCHFMAGIRMQKILKFLDNVKKKCPLSRLESRLCKVLKDHDQALTNAQAGYFLLQCKCYI